MPVTINDCSSGRGGVLVKSVIERLREQSVASETSACRQEVLSGTDTKDTKDPDPHRRLCGSSDGDTPRKGIEERSARTVADVVSSFPVSAMVSSCVRPMKQLSRLEEEAAAALAGETSSEDEQEKEEEQDLPQRYPILDVPSPALTQWSTLQGRRDTLQRTSSTAELAGQPHETKTLGGEETIREAPKEMEAFPALEAYQQELQVLRSERAGLLRAIEAQQRTITAFQSRMTAWEQRLGEEKINPSPPPVLPHEAQEEEQGGVEVHKESEGAGNKMKTTDHWQKSEHDISKHHERMITALREMGKKAEGIPRKEMHELREIIQKDCKNVQEKYDRLQEALSRQTDEVRKKMHRLTLLEKEKKRCSEELMEWQSTLPTIVQEQQSTVYHVLLGLRKSLPTSRRQHRFSSSSHRCRRRLPSEGEESEEEGKDKCFCALVPQTVPFSSLPCSGRREMKQFSSSSSTPPLLTSTVQRISSGNAAIVQLTQQLVTLFGRAWAEYADKTKKWEREQQEWKHQWSIEKECYEKRIQQIKIERDEAVQERTRTEAERAALLADIGTLKRSLHEQEHWVASIHHERQQEEDREKESNVLICQQLTEEVQQLTRLLQTSKKEMNAIRCELEEGRKECAAWERVVHVLLYPQNGNTKVGTVREDTFPLLHQGTSSEKALEDDRKWDPLPTTVLHGIDAASSALSSSSPSSFSTQWTSTAPLLQEVSQRWSVPHHAKEYLPLRELLKREGKTPEGRTLQESKGGASATQEGTGHHHLQKTMEKSEKTEGRKEMEKEQKKREEEKGGASNDGLCARSLLLSSWRKKERLPLAGSISADISFSSSTTPAPAVPAAYYQASTMTKTARRMRTPPPYRRSPISDAPSSAVHGHHQEEESTMREESFVRDDRTPRLSSTSAGVARHTTSLITFPTTNSRPRSAIENEPEKENVGWRSIENVLSVEKEKEETFIQTWETKPLSKRRSERRLPFYRFSSSSSSPLSFEWECGVSSTGGEAPSTSLDPLSSSPSCVSSRSFFTLSRRSMESQQCHSHSHATEEGRSEGTTTRTTDEERPFTSSPFPRTPNRMGEPHLLYHKPQEGVSRQRMADGTTGMNVREGMTTAEYTVVSDKRRPLAFPQPLSTEERKGEAMSGITTSGMVDGRSGQASRPPFLR